MTTGIKNTIFTGGVIVNCEHRKKYILECFESCEEPLKGQKLAKTLGVTRQVIVKDIAILRASGKNIIATPKGYVLSKNVDSKIKKVIAVCHKREEIQDELETIVKFGGIIEDVIIEHKLYGEIRGILMIKTIFDVENFIKKLNEFEAEPLSVLTMGVHLHTISAENEIELNNIIGTLKRKGYLITE